MGGIAAEADVRQPVENDHGLSLLSDLFPEDTRRRIVSQFFGRALEFGIEFRIQNRLAVLKEHGDHFVHILAQLVERFALRMGPRPSGHGTDVKAHRPIPFDDDRVVAHNLVCQIQSIFKPGIAFANFTIASVETLLSEKLTFFKFFKTYSFAIAASEKVSLRSWSDFNAVNLAISSR